VIGDGIEMDKLKKMVSDMGLDDRVKFLGFKQDEELARILNRHRCMVVPSLDVEGFGIVALEGMACGCAMIVSDAGGLAEAVGDYGYVFPMGNRSKLSELMANTINTAASQEFDESGLTNYLNEHTRKRVAQKYLQLFENGVKQK
jgi:glycosyltransferase involved in cell wall biosynthesis